MAPIFGRGIGVLPGQVVRSGVEPNDPMCFPNWDSRGACKTYLVTPPKAGRLRVSLTWTSAEKDDLMDLFLVAPTGFWVGSYEGKSEEVAQMDVTAGLT